MPRENGAIHMQMDLANQKQISSTFLRAQPEVVIHCAGNKNVSECEENPTEAMQVNAIGTRTIAKACKEADARLVYLSTDYVFTGSRGKYKESDIPNPTTAYGASKFLGEKMARLELPNMVICRASGIYGVQSPLLGWAKSILEKSEPLYAFTDIINTPTYVMNLGAMIERIINFEAVGVFHTVGSDACSRYDFFKLYAELFGFNKDLVRPATAACLQDLHIPPNLSLIHPRTTRQFHNKMVHDSALVGLSNLRRELR